MSYLKFESAVANQSEAVEADTISKNGRNLKSQTSRVNLMKKRILFFIAFCISIANAIAQDIITLKNGDDIQAIVQEIGDVDIKYKKFDNSNGPNYSLKKSEIFMIRYQNGTKDVFQSENQEKKDITTDFSTIPKIISEKENFDLDDWRYLMFKRNKNIWQTFVEKNEKLGFTKRIIPLESFSPEDQEAKFGYVKNDFYYLSNGIWLNYDDKLIKFREGESSYFVTIPFQALYDVGIDMLGISKTKGWGIGDAVSFFSAKTTEHLTGITVQVVVKDTNGGVKTIELKLFNAWIGSWKRGTPYPNAYEKCATAIMNELSYIIDNY